MADNPLPERLHWTEVGDEADEDGVDPAMNAAAPEPARAPRIRSRADVIGATADRILRIRELAAGSGWWLPEGSIVPVLMLYPFMQMILD